MNESPTGNRLSHESSQRLHSSRVQVKSMSLESSQWLQELYGEQKGEQ